MIGGYSPVKPHSLGVVKPHSLGGDVRWVQPCQTSFFRSCQASLFRRGYSPVKPHSLGVVKPHSLSVTRVRASCRCVADHHRDGHTSCVTHGLVFMLRLVCMHHAGV